MNIARVAIAGLGDMVTGQQAVIYFEQRLLVCGVIGAICRPVAAP